MPGPSGLEVVGQLRREGHALPAVIMTGEIKDRKFSALGRSGVALLEKPFRPAELLDCINRALDRQEDVSR